jgi:Ca-activated chloride channel family protein
MTFLEPTRLWLLLGVAALLAAYVIVQWRRRAYTVKFTNLELLASVAPRRPGWRRHLPAAVQLLALTSLVLALAQPSREERVPRERATIMMAIDVSLSMQATDVEPSRIEAAKDAAKVFVDILPPKINVGLVAFNGNASLKVPPTTDRQQVKAAIDALELGERTAIGEAIFTCLDALRQVPPDDEGTQPPARIVLMSDGTTTDGRPNDLAARAAREAGVPVSTIAFGTDRGTITVPEEPLPIRVPVDRAALRAIAEQTGGRFYTAGSEQQLTEVYENIGSSVGYVTEPREITTWFVGLGVALLAAAGVLSLVWFSRLP